jgi:Ca2+-binding RTX toxin-like protein
MFQAHASFAIDWGDATDGIQDPPGHRQNIMNGDYREAGIGVLNAPKGKSTGPILVTEDLGDRFNLGNSYFLGTVYNDTNHDGFYEAGEGIGGATIKLTGTPGTFSTTSMSAGGYQIQVPTGTYTVTATSPALGGTITLSSVTIGGANVQRDFRPDMVSFGSMAKGVLTINGTADADTIGVIERSGNLQVRRNGSLETFAASSVSQLNISAGAGNDVIDFSGIIINTYVDAGDGNDLVTGGSGNDTITGGAGKNTVYGGDGNDRLNGSGSPDHLYGQAGDDRLYGNGGNDYMDGGGGVDRLFGGDGNDTLLGGSSNDKLYGEAGDDQLYGQGQADLLDGGDGMDAAQSDDLDTLVSIEQAIA